MKVVGTIRPTEPKEIEVDAPSYLEAFELMKAQVPKGWQLLQVKGLMDPAIASFWGSLVGGGAIAAGVSFRHLRLPRPKPARAQALLA